MTTSSLKPTTPTTQNLRSAAASPVRESNRRIGNVTPRPACAARRFLSVLMNSLSAWAVLLGGVVAAGCSPPREGPPEPLRVQVKRAVFGLFVHQDPPAPPPEEPPAQPPR